MSQNELAVVYLAVMSSLVWLHILVMKHIILHQLSLLMSKWRNVVALNDGLVCWKKYQSLVNACNMIITPWSGICSIQFRNRWCILLCVMSVMASQITSVSIVCSAVCPGADQRKHLSSASLAFVRGIHRWPVNSTHKWPVTRETFPFDDVIMYNTIGENYMCRFSVHLRSNCR